MSMFSSFARFFKTLFGQVEGKTERLADDMVTASPDSIRSQYRKIREDRIRDYEEMKKQVASLVSIQDARHVSLKEIQIKIVDFEGAMTGALEEFKRTQDERARAAYGMLAEQKEASEARINELDAEIEIQKKQISKYHDRLTQMKREIDSLKTEEAQAVMDITSHRQLKSINDRIQGITVDAHEKNLQAIREAASLAKSQIKLDSSLNSNPADDYMASLKAAGKHSKHLSAFDEAVKIDRVFVDSPKAIEAPKKIDEQKRSETLLDKMFKD